MDAMVISPPQAMTIDDFITRYDAEGPFEIIQGEIIKLMPQLPGHNLISKKLVMMLLMYEEQGIGSVFFEAPFVIVDETNWVKGSRVPDVMFYLQERLEIYQAQNPDWQEKPYVLIPDLAIEVISKNDSYEEVEQKIQGYLADGVQQVWLINPRRQAVTVFTPTQAPQFLSGEDELTGGDLLPDLKVVVKTLFTA